MNAQQAANLQVQIKSLRSRILENLTALDALSNDLAAYTYGDRKIADLMELVCNELRVGYKTTWITKDHKTKYVVARRITYKTIRIATGLTIREIAHAMGVDYSTISLALRILTPEENAIAERLANIK